jgi:hypothetical protein
MKHFTPERYLQLGNLDDEQAFLAAHQQWEDAITAYGEQLQRIQPGLPPGLRDLVRSLYLHDARVLAMHQDERWFIITLQPPSDPDRLVVLGYSLVEEPRIERQALPAEFCRVPIEWLYDELDLDQAVLRHDILLSNGWEVNLRFRWAWVKRPLRIIPVVPSCSTHQSTESQSA